MKRMQLVGALLATTVAACQQHADNVVGHGAMGAARPQAATAAPANATLVQPPRPAELSLSAEEIATRDPAQVALTEDEADWLSRNGYLTQKELDSLAHLDPKALEDRTRNAGDTRAATMLGVRRLNDGDFDGATIALDRAAGQGSLYALEQLAVAELNGMAKMTSRRVDRVSPDIQALFVARMEQARMLGDHRVDFYIAKYAGTLDRKAYADAVLRQTSEFMRQLAENAALTERVSLAPNLRPNGEQWAQLKPGTTQQVLVPGG